MPNVEWLPNRRFFLPDATRLSKRPVFQGDVFADVPMAMYGGSKEVGDDGKPLTAKPVFAMLLGHPCSMRVANGRLKSVQTIARVIESPEHCAEWTHPWAGQYALFPLPQLDGENDYVVDLNQIGICNSEHLHDRVACLDREGWNGLQWRLVHFFSRFELDLPSLPEINDGLWNEIDLWAAWCDLKGEEDGFQEWLNEASSSRPDVKRLHLLAGDVQTLRRELATA